MTVVARPEAASGRGSPSRNARVTCPLAWGTDDGVVGPPPQAMGHRCVWRFFAGASAYCDATV